MAKIQRAKVIYKGLRGKERVYRQFADGYTEPADEEDVHRAFAVRSTVVTRHVVVQLGVMRDGKFTQLGREDVPALGTIEGPVVSPPTRG